MRLDITFRNCHTTDALRERAEKKFKKVAKHLREPIEAQLNVHVEKHRHCAELTVSAAGEVFKAAEESGDMYSTIDGLMSKAERVARRHRERNIDRSQHGVREPEVILD